MTVKLKDIKKFKGLVGRITFFDKITKYFRIEYNEAWKANGYEPQLEEPTPEELAEYNLKEGRYEL
jgi:hypothetical protein